MTMVWQPIETAPKNIRIDLLAKCWLAHKDEFRLTRFPDCRWSNGDSMCNVDPHWIGLDNGWRAVGWMHIPLLQMPQTVVAWADGQA